MEFVTTKRRKIPQKGRDSTFTSDNIAYTKSNGLYVIPPTEEISIEQFETFGLDRVKGICKLKFRITTLDGLATIAGMSRKCSMK